MGAVIRTANTAPALGDTVHYVMPDESIYPAIVIRVHNFGCCDLQVMTHEGLVLKLAAPMRAVRTADTWHWAHQI